MACLPLSSACLDATTISHASGAWSRIFHLMQVCCLPWCPGCPVLCVLRAWLLGVCVSLALLCALPPGLPVPLWPGAVGLCSALLLVCGPAMPALWAGLVRGPCLWASYKPLLYGPILRPCISVLIWASEKVLYFCLIFRLCIPVLFPGFVFALKFPARFSGLQRLDFFSGFFRVDFSGEKFPGYFFRALFSGIFSGLIFAAVSGFLFFLDVIFIRFPVLRDKFFHVVKFQELVHGGLVDSVALAF